VTYNTRCVALGLKRRDVRPALHDHAVGALLHLGDDPISRLARARAAGHPRPEIKLRLDVAHRGFGVERRLGTGEPVGEPLTAGDAECAEQRW